MEYELIAEKDDEPVLDEAVHMPADDSVNQSQSNDIHATNYVHRKRKAQVSDGIHPLCDLLAIMHKDKNDHLDGLTDRLSYQAELGKAQNEVYALVQGIPNLSIEKQFDIGDILVERLPVLSIFQGIA